MLQTLTFLLGIMLLSANAFGQQSMEEPSPSKLQDLLPETQGPKITTPATEQKAKEKHTTFVPFVAPSYSPEMQFLLSGGAFLLFSTDDASPRSTVVLSALYSTNGSFATYLVYTAYLLSDRLRIRGEVNFQDMPWDYWGVGLNAGMADPGSSVTGYKRQSMASPVEVLIQSQPGLFIGPVIDFQYESASEASQSILDDANFQKYGDEIMLLGGGVMFEYDTRDFTGNPYSGLFVRAGLTSYRILKAGDQDPFAQWSLDIRNYQTVFRPGSVIALRLLTSASVGDVPYNKMWTLGGSEQLRGYTEGRFRDRAVMQAVMEYRVTFGGEYQAGRGIFKQRPGLVAWVGLGSLGDTYFDLDGALPNTGIGFRYEVEERQNIRIDYGFGLNESALYITFEEAY